MNSTTNASSEFWNCATLFSSKAFIGGTVALCLITVVSLVGNSPLIRSKLCPFFILATWIVAVAVSSPYLFAVKLVENSGRMQCDRNAGWKEAFGEFSSFSDFAIVIYILFIYIPVLLLVILYSIILIKLKTQVHPGEHSSRANVEQLRQRRNRSVLYMSIAIISMFVLLVTIHN